MARIPKLEKPERRELVVILNTLECCQRVAEEIEGKLPSRIRNDQDFRDPVVKWSRQQSEYREMMLRRIAKEEGIDVEAVF